MNLTDYQTEQSRLIEDGVYWVEDGIVGMIPAMARRGHLYVFGSATPLHPSTIVRIAGRMDNVLVSPPQTGSATSSWTQIMEQCGSFEAWLRRIMKCYPQGVTIGSVSSFVGVHRDGVTNTMRDLIMANAVFTLRTYRRMIRLHQGRHRTFSEQVKVYHYFRGVYHVNEIEPERRQARPVLTPENPDFESDANHLVPQDLQEEAERVARARLYRAPGTIVRPSGADMRQAMRNLAEGRTTRRNAMEEAMEVVRAGGLEVAEASLVNAGYLEATERTGEGEDEFYVEPDPKPAEPEFPPDTGVYRGEICID
jgi:hypothetical protein